MQIFQNHSVIIILFLQINYGYLMHKDSSQKQLLFDITENVSLITLGGR